MGLNIQELLKLDRLRDEKIEGTGVKRRLKYAEIQKSIEGN